MVDSGSTDGTVALAEARGARVIHQEWLGFGRQKQFAVSGGAARLGAVPGRRRARDARAWRSRSARRSPAAASRPGAWRGATASSARGSPTARGTRTGRLRLFHRAHASWSNDEVHEAVLTTAEVGRLEGDLLHDSAEDVATYMAKQNRYTTLHAEALYRQGVRAGYARLFVNPLVRFLKFYVFKLGLPRRRARIRARRDRLQQHLPQVPQAHRAPEGRQMTVLAAGGAGSGSVVTRLGALVSAKTGTRESAE